MFVKRFKSRLLLEKLRGKRLMFVGDSLNRNQWESMVCLVQSAISPGKKSLDESGSSSIFRIEVHSSLSIYSGDFLILWRLLPILSYMSFYSEC